MKFAIGAFVCLLFGIGLALASQAGAGAGADENADADKSDQLDPQALLERSSYAIGLNAGRSLKREGISLDLTQFTAGMKAAMSDEKPRWTNEELKAAMDQFQKDHVAKAGERMATLAAKNAKEGEDFLAKNKEKKGVTTLPSGLQYEVVKSGDGDSPGASAKVRTHYRGKLIDGTEFDSSYERGEPAVFPVDGVIKGWTEALQLMKVGDHWRLFVPADLAYGARGSAPEIGPNAVLIFDIELLGIEE